MRRSKLVIGFVLAIILFASFSVTTILIGNRNANTEISSPLAISVNDNSLFQFEWPQFQGDSSFTRFSAGPAPATSSILWKSNVTGIQPYLVAFNGMIYVCTNTSVVALDQTGKQVWETPITMNGTWPIAYKIDNSHMIVESCCLNPQTGKFYGQVQISYLIQVSSQLMSTVLWKKCSTLN